jgi:hypothetical protein
MRSGQTASGLVSRYGNYYAEDIIDDVNQLPRLMKQAKKKLCSDLFREIVLSQSWGLGVLGSISKVPAQSLQGYLGAVFEDVE